MKRTLVLLLAASLFLVSPALASAARGDGHGGGQKIVTREKVVIYQTSQQRDHRYDRSDRHRYEHSDRHGDRQIRNYYRPPRHAPAYGYYKNHYSHRHQPKKDQCFFSTVYTAWECGKRTNEGRFLRGSRARSLIG